MKLVLFVLLLGVVPALAASDTLDQAFDRLYNHDFPGGQKVLDGYIGAHPQDPLGYAVRGTAYLYQELDRQDVFSNQFLASDEKIASTKTVRPDPRVHGEFERATAMAEKLAKVTLAKDANDRNALLAMCFTSGAQRDYLALIDKKLRLSLNYAKDAQSYAVRLLKVDPQAYDAYFTTGFSEYLLANLPFFVKWFVKFDDAQGSKEQGLKDMERVAQSGHYLKPFAQMMLANLYVRENRLGDSEKLLAELTREYPENTVFRRELDKLTAQRQRHG